MTTRKRLQIIAASVERNRRRDAEFAQKQKERSVSRERYNHHGCCNTDSRPSGGRCEPQKPPQD